MAPSRRTPQNDLLLSWRHEQKPSFVGVTTGIFLFFLFCSSKQREIPRNPWGFSAGVKTKQLRRRQPYRSLGGVHSFCGASAVSFRSGEARFGCGLAVGFFRGVRGPFGRVFGEDERPYISTRVGDFYKGLVRRFTLFEGKKGLFW